MRNHVPFCLRENVGTPFTLLVRKREWYGLAISFSMGFLPPSFATPMIVIGSFIPTLHGRLLQRPSTLTPLTTHKPHVGGLNRDQESNSSSK